MAVRRTCGLVSSLMITWAVAVGPAHAVTKGDVNDDGSVDAADIAPFIAVLLGRNTDLSAICAADVNSNGDTDADDIPSLVESILCSCGCTEPSDCGLGEDCIGGYCEPAGILGIAISDELAPCDSGPNRMLEDGDTLNLCASFSGFLEFFLTIRAAGFEPGATVDFSYSLRDPNAQSCGHTASCPPVQVCGNGVCSIGFGDWIAMQTTDTGCGVNQLDFFDILFSGPAALDGQETILSATITDSNNPSITVSKTIQVILDAHTFCFTPGQCPPNHVCMNNYCVPN